MKSADFYLCSYLKGLITATIHLHLVHEPVWGRCSHRWWSTQHTHTHTHTHIYTGAGHIIRISSKSWFISLIPFKKWNLYNVYIHSTQTDIFQVFISFNFDDYNWQLMKTPNSVSQKIWIFLKTNTKKGFLEILANWKVWTWKVWACTAVNTLLGLFLPKLLQQCGVAWSRSVCGTAQVLWEPRLLW